MGNIKKKYDPGLGEFYSNKTRRIINKDGSFNIHRKGMRLHIYHYLLDIKNIQFFGLLTLVYVLVNCIFALIYLRLGIENLGGSMAGMEKVPFLRALFFSMQTLTTVGFGGIFPDDPRTNFVSGMEAMIGLLFIALVTGLVYGRFSKPSARLRFSNNALIAPYEDGISLVFRVVNRRPNVLMEMEGRMMAVMDQYEGDNVVRRYFNLRLETSNIHFFPLSWSLVHPITEGSPLYGLDKAGLAKYNVEILSLIKGFDESFSQEVHVRFSYTWDEIIWGAKFIRNFYSDEDGEIILDIDKVHQYELIDLPKYFIGETEYIKGRNYI